MSKNQDEYLLVKVESVGLLDPFGMEGGIRLAAIADPTLVLDMGSFSGEVASHVSRFVKGDRSSLPTIYNMLEKMADQHGLHLVRVNLYSTGDGSAIRGDLYFDGRKKELVLEGYRASDSIALATLYDAPMYAQKTLLSARKAGPGSA